MVSFCCPSREAPNDSVSPRCDNRCFVWRQRDLAVTGQIESIFRLGIALIFPLACIWFPDELGTLTGILMGLARPQITQPTPGIAVAVGRWILMITVTVHAAGGWRIFRLER